MMRMYGTDMLAKFLDERCYALLESAGEVRLTLMLIQRENCVSKPKQLCIRLNNNTSLQ